MQQLSLSTKVTKFLADLLLQIPNVAIHNNLRAGTSTITDPTADRKARVTISVKIPQYDGSKGNSLILQLLKNFQSQNGTPCSWILLRKRP